MKQAEILEIFQQTGALLSGHFLLSSGLHSGQYFQCAKVLQYPELAERLCSEIAAHFSKQNTQAVIAPAVGGILVAHEAARFLKARALFSERENGVMALRRGFEIQAGENILVVEDVVTTGGSVREVIELVRTSGGGPVGIGCIVDRSGGQVNFGIELFSLIKLHIAATPPESCDLCKQGLPLVKPGSRKATNG
jgi:orotate phosphoribosyltransferase